MYIEAPIKLSREDFILLMEETNRHRICWMYHDVLSDQQIARLFTRLARIEEEEDWQEQTVMAWVAPCRQENSYYLLFKWYSDFYDPPERIELFLVHRQPGTGGEPVLRLVEMAFTAQLNERGLNWYRNLWGMVSDNVSWFFGEEDFEENAMRHILQKVASHRGEEMEVFEWYYRRRSDGELSLQCRTLEAYFRCIGVVMEMVHSTLEARGEPAGDDPYTQMLWGILERMSAVVELNQVSSYALSFSKMADGFFRQPVRAPVISRNARQQLISQTERGDIRWLRLRDWESQDTLRELYFQCNPLGLWDVFQPWRGEMFFTVLRRSVAVEAHRGVYVLTRFADQRGGYVTDLFWLENTMGCVAHLCGGELLEELLDSVRDSYVQEKELPDSKEERTITGIYHDLREIYEAVEDKKRRRQ